MKASKFHTIIIFCAVKTQYIKQSLMENQGHCKCTDTFGYRVTFV